MEQDWSEQYKIVWNIFLAHPQSVENGISRRCLSRYLGISSGKTQKWEAGQWPSAEDLSKLHDKLGLSYRWLVTGIGEPFDSEGSAANLNDSAEAERLRSRVAELERENATLKERLLAAHEANTEMGRANAKLSELVAKQSEQGLDRGDVESAGAVRGVPQGGILESFTSKN